MSFFKYLTIADIRAAGVTEDEVSDSSALSLIIEASECINDMTDNWFTPVRKTLVLDGNGSRQILLPAPIIELSSTTPTHNSDNETREILVARVGAYEPYIAVGSPTEIPRSVARPVGRGDIVYQSGDWFLRSVTRFPEGINNISVTGWFGHLASPTVKYETTLAATLSNGDEEIELTNRAGFIKDKVMVFLDENDEQLYTTLSSGATGTTGILIEEITDLDEDLPPGTQVITFGKVPIQIKRACLIEMHELKASLTDLLNEGTNRILEEKTDNYHYKLAKGDDVSPGLGGGSYLTSILKLISNYVKPSFVGFA